jgi:1,2-phenylacetyl-CoA epoxidase catalytic subunit
MLTAFLEAARDSDFVQLQQRARKILQEERSHQIHAEAWAQRLARSDNDRDAFSAAVELVWQQAAGWPGEDERYATLARNGIVTGSPDDLRESVRAAVAAALADTPLTLTLA